MCGEAVWGMEWYGVLGKDEKSTPGTCWCLAVDRQKISLERVASSDSKLALSQNSPFR